MMHGRWKSDSEARYSRRAGARHFVSALSASPKDVARISAGSKMVS
jgi:hypothetical protein